MGCCGSNEKGNFQLPPFQKPNKYWTSQSPQENEEDEINTIIQHIAPNQPKNDYRDLAYYILKSSNRQFVDPNFKVEEDKNQSEFLENLGNQKNSKVYWDSETRTDSFKQNELELCYLTSVFYAICQNPQIKKQIFLSPHISPQKAYIIQMFCNGAPTKVIVDEKIPVSSQESIAYLNIIRGKQIWPFLLEKAWCKQIGSYKKALGLSPEDCFEEITGIPAYSYEIQFLMDHEIKEVIKRKENWIVLTAKISRNSSIRARQIFYVEQVKSQRQIYLRSPYFSYTFEREERGGSRIVMSIDQIRQYFQFLTVGYIYPNYKTISIPFQSKKREDVFYELNIKQAEEINIRFSQFYEEYFQDAVSKSGYDYSPVFMELFNEKGEFVQDCEGCPKSLEGNRTSNIIHQVFAHLKPGIYYLRIEIDWLNEAVLNRGNVLIYASKGNVEIERIQKNQLLTEKILSQCFAVDEITNSQSESEIKIKITERKYRFLLELNNISHKSLHAEVTMNSAENIRIKGRRLDNNSWKEPLNRFEKKVFEILPQNPKKSYYLPSISVKKV